MDGNGINGMTELGRMDKAPIYFQVAAEGGVGKTHTSISSFPRPFLIDCTAHGDGKFTAKKLLGERFDTCYFYARGLFDVIGVVKDVIDSGEFATIVFDEYSGLRRLGQEWYLKEFKKNKVFPTTEWGVITRKINRDIIWKALDNDINVVVTSGFSDTYKDGDKTGGRNANSPPGASIDIDFRIMLAENKSGDDVDVIVMKNKFMSIRDRNKSMKFPLTWGAIKKECVFVGFEYCE